MHNQNHMAFTLALSSICKLDHINHALNSTWNQPLEIEVMINIQIEQHNQNYNYVNLISCFS